MIPPESPLAGLRRRLEARRPLAKSDSLNEGAAGSDAAGKRARPRARASACSTSVRGRLGMARPSHPADARTHAQTSAL